VVDGSIQAHHNTDVKLLVGEGALSSASRAFFVGSQVSSGSELTGPRQTSYFYL